MVGVPLVFHLIVFLILGKVILWHPVDAKLNVYQLKAFLADFTLVPNA